MTINVGCVHLQYAYSHCAEMLCPNYINKCPRHGIAVGSATTATCNLERGKVLVGMSQETKDLAVKMVGLDPALEDSILLLIDLVARDALDNEL